MPDKENYINRPGVALGLPKTPMVPFPKLGTGEADRGTGAMSLNDYFENQMKSIKPTGVEDIPLSSFYIGERYPETRPGTDYEEMYAQQQSAASKLKNGTLKMIGTAGTTLASGTIGLVYGIGASVLEQRLASLIDNDVTRAMDRMSKNFEDYAPNYFTKAEQDAEWYSTDNLLTANFFSDKIIKNLGFALGALGGGVSWSKAFKAIGLTNALVKAGAGLEAATAVEQAMTNVPKLEKYAAIESALNSVAQKYIKTPVARVLNNSDRILTSTMATFGEASIEGLQNMNEFRNKAIEEYRDLYGVAPTGEDLQYINQMSDRIGMYTWGFNSILLTATNYIQLPKILGSSRRADKARINEIGRKAIGEDFTKTVAKTAFGKLVDNVKGVAPLLFSGSEAFEEGAQFAIQTGVNEYFNRAYRNKESAKSFLSSISEVSNNIFGEGIEKTLNTKEGLENIIIGGLSGALQQAGYVGSYVDEQTGKTKFGFGKSGRLGERGLFGLGGERGRNTDIAVSALNKTKIADVLEDQAKYVAIALGSQQMRQQAIVNNDRLSEKDYETDYLFSYLMPRAKYGKMESVKKELDYYESQALTDEGLTELKTAGIVNEAETREQFLSRINNLRSSAKRFDQLYSAIRDKYENVLDKDNRKKYSDDVLDKLVYAASKVADYDVRIPLENQSLVEAGINTLPILESIINEFTPNKAATEEALNQINDMKDVISDKRDDLKSALTNVIELSMRRKLFIDEYDNIKNKPEDFETPSEFAFGETEELPVGVKQFVVPEGKKRRKELEKKLEIGEEYSLKVPYMRQGNNFVFGPKIKIVSQTLGGELEVRMPNGKTRFLSPEEFKSYEISEHSPVTPRLSQILNDTIDSVLKRKKYDSLEKPEENKLEYINSLDNKELMDDIEKEFKKRSAQYLKDLANETARAELLAKYKEQLQKTQEEIEKLSSDIPTNDDESDSAIVDTWEDMKKIVQRLFTSSTHISEDFEAGNIPAHITRFIEFTNNVKELKKKFDIKVMLVTSAQENLLGLDGLSAMSFGSLMDKSLLVTKEQFDALSDEKKKEVILNGFVGAVAIKIDNKGNKTFIDKDGNSIGVVGETDATTGVPKKIDLGKVVFSTMPSVNLYNSKNEPKYRNKEKEEATRYVAAWEEYRKRLFEGDPRNFFEFDFGVSKGIPNINYDAPEKNFVGDVMLKDQKRINTEQFVVVSTKGEIAHEDGNNYKFAAGRPAFKNDDDLVYLNNNKFSKKKAATLFAILKRISDGVHNQAVNNQQINLNIPEMSDFISNTMFWYSKGGPSANKIYIDDKNLLHIGKKEGDKIVESIYDFANIGKFETEIINDLQNSYHNVNNKTFKLGLAKQFVEFYLDSNNELQRRVWPNYQSYLLSSENPDGSKRSIDDVPLYTRISKPTSAVPYALKQKYIFLLGMELPVTLPKKTKDEVKNNTSEYVLDGTTINRYTSKDIIDFGDYFEFTAKLNNAGKIVVENAETEHNINVIDKIDGNPSLKRQMKDFLGKYFPAEMLDELGNDAEFVKTAIASIIQIDVREKKQKESQGAPATSTEPAPKPAEAPTTPPSPPASNPDLSSLDDDDASYRAVGAVGKQVERMSDAEMEYFKDFMSKKLPGIPYEFVENLIRINGTDEEAWGVFEDGVAKVYKRAAKGTAFHEIMEGVWVGFLSPEKQKALLDEMRSKKGSFLDRASGRRIDHSEATDLQLKERIMDDAADYFAGKIPAKSITGKILQFFKAIVEFFKHWIGKPSLKEQLFRDIAKGKYRTLAFPEERRKARPQYKPIEELSEQVANDYVQDMAARVYQVIFKNEESLFDVVKSMNKLDVFNYIKGLYRKAGVFDSIAEETYDKLVGRTKDFLAKFNIEFDENNVMSFNDENRTKDGYAADTFKVNFKKSSPYAVKLLLSSLIRAERKSGPMGTLLQIPDPDRSNSTIKGFTLVPYGQTFSTLMNKLSNVRDIPTFINKLYELAKDNPDYVRLYTRLGGDMTGPKINFANFKDHNWRLFISFYQVFTKQKPEAFVQFLEDGQVYTGSANQASLVKQIADEWKENMKLLSDTPDALVKFDASAGLYKVDKTSNEWKSINITSPQGMVKFLDSIGVYFPIDAYNRLPSKDLGKFADAVSGIKTALNKSDVLMSIKSRDFDMKGNVEALSRMYVSATNPVEDSTFFNNMGERQQSYTEANYPSFFESVFNSVESITELKEKMPQLNDVFSANSVLLKAGGSLFDENGYRRKNTPIKVQYILGNKNVDVNKGESISGLTIGKRNVLEINQNIRGSYYVVIPGDGSTEWMMNLGNTISFAEVQSGEFLGRLSEIFDGYLKDEINLIKDASNRRKIKYVSSKANQLRFMRGVLSESLVEDIEKLAQTPNVSDEEINEFLNNETNREKINSSIKSFVEDIVKQQEKVLVDNNEIVSMRAGERIVYKGLDKSMSSLGVNKYNLNEKSLKEVLTFAVVNYTINQIEYHKILFGDPYQFKITKKNSKIVIDETKRIKSSLGPRRVTVNFGVLNNWLNRELNNVAGVPLTKKDFGYHQHKDYAKTFTATDVKIIGSLASKFSAYEDTDEADASSLMNPGAYREVKWKNGQWTPEAEDFYQWQMAYTRQKLNQKGKYEYQKNERGTRLREHDEKLMEKPCPRFYIDVMKPVVSGNKFQKNQIDLVIDKTSQLPIFYQAVEDTNLEELFIKMFEGGYDYVIFESGRKVGTESSYNLYKGNGEFNDEEINNTIEVPWDAYGIQVENSYGSEKLQPRGSQLTKLADIDLYSQGEPVGSNDERKKVIQSAVRRSNESLKQLISNGYKSFIKKLGIEDLGTSYVVPDKKKVAKLLKDEMLRTDVSYNTLDTLDIDPNTGEFAINFESSVNYKRIKDVLYSMVDKFVSSPKMNGFSAVQVAATMWENSKEGRELVEKIENEDGTFSYRKVSRKEYDGLSEEKKKNIKFTSSTLKFYEDEDGKRHCEIMIPNWFRKKLGRDLTKEEFTDILNSEQGRKMLTGIGFRIPTQALNSVEVFVVKGFLPDFMGRTVVVPSEITTKAGSDFDIDKLNLYLKNVYVSRSGRIVEVPFFGYGEEAKAKLKDFAFQEDIKEMFDVEEDFVGEREDNYETLAEKLYQESLENEYYNSLIELLTLPENFGRLVVPNSSKQLEELADELSDLRGEKDDPNPMKTLLNRVEMTNLRQTFVMAKNWVGRAATNITAHSLFQKTTMYVKPYSFKMSLPHNTITVNDREHISFSNYLDRAGKYISDTLSMFANSFVDVVKDPYIMKIIYSDRLVSTFMMLTRAGVPIRTIGLFMNQPIIREYVSKLDAQGVSPFTAMKWSILDGIRTEYPATQTQLAKGVINATDESLAKNISANTENALTNEQKLQQRLILEEFLSYFDLASELFDITMAINYDTTRFRSEDELYRKQLFTKANETDNLISSPKKILESSHMGILERVLDKSSEALSSLLKFNRPEFRAVLEDVIKEYAENKYLGKDKFKKVAEKMIASFLDYIIQVKRPLAIKSLVVDADSVANRIDEARPKHPEVKILKDLVVVSSDVPGGAKTVKLRVNTKDAYDEDMYVGYMREMRDNPATRDLYEDLIKLAIIQGTYYSSVSIKNILPSEDYARVVAPIMDTLQVDDEINAFRQNKMFQRNLFKDENIVPSISPKFFTTENKDEDESDYIIGFDENDVEIYQYSTKSFPTIPELGLGQNQRALFTLDPRLKGSNNSVVTVKRLINVGQSIVDFVTGRTVTKAHYSERKAKGDRTIYDVYGYKRVEEEDGEPFMTEDGYYVYKQINLVGDGQLATEYKVFPDKSVINNGTVKVDMEIPDRDIIRYFVNKSTIVSDIKDPRTEWIPFSQKNIDKITSGKKTSTLRNESDFRNIGIPVGQTKKLMIGNREFNVTNRGKMSVEQAGGKLAMAKSEGLPTSPDEQNKYVIDVDGVNYYSMYTQTQSWFNGTGADLYVYSIAPVSPAQKQPLYTFVEAVAPAAPAKEVKTIDKISKPTESKRLAYTVYNEALGRNVTKNGYKLTIPEFPNAELYITQESISQESVEGSTEANIKSKKWSIEIVHPTKGVMGFPTPDYAVNKKDVIDSFVKDVNEKYSKNKSNRETLAEVGIDFNQPAQAPVSDIEKRRQEALNKAFSDNKKSLQNQIKEAIKSKGWSVNNVLFHGGPKFDKFNKQFFQTGEFSNIDMRRVAQSMGVRIPTGYFSFAAFDVVALRYALKYGKNNPTLYIINNTESLGAEEITGNEEKNTQEWIVDGDSLSDFITVPLIPNADEINAIYDAELKEKTVEERVPQITLSKDGKTYYITDVNSLMLRDLGYTDEEVRVILSAIQNTHPQKDIFKC